MSVHEHVEAVSADVAGFPGGIAGYRRPGGLQVPYQPIVVRVCLRSAVQLFPDVLFGGECGDVEEIGVDVRPLPDRLVSTRYTR